MGDKHVVRFEPVGIEIEVDEEQTILRAAFEQGIMLMHGCKEGQCSSCKSFVLDGDDIELDRYSTFALPDFEKEEGYTLLCRAHAYEDLTIELLNYDEEMIRSGPADPAGRGRGRVQRAGHPRHAAPGAAAGRARGDQVLPRPVHGHRGPGHRGDPVVLDGEHLGRESGQLEFVIKVYPDGLFSHFLDARAAGRRPARPRAGRSACSRCARAHDADLVFVGGGAGMAPILSLLRSMAERGITRKATYYYGARGRRDLCFEDELRALEETLPGFRYVPALSEPADDDGWDGETGLITDVVRRHETDLRRGARLRLRAAADGRGGDAAAQPRSACRRSTSTTTSSPRPVIPTKGEA